MHDDDVTARLDALEKLARTSAEQVDRLQMRLTALEDIEAIKRLQRSYGYYFERGMNEEIAELFSEADDAAIYFRGIGGFLGRHAKQSWEKHLPGMGGATYLHVLMMSSGVVTLAPDGVSANGRWYGSGKVAIPLDHIAPGAINHFEFFAVYENQYVKEDGVWKIKVLDVSMLFKSPNPGFVDEEKYKVVFFDPTEDAIMRGQVQKMFDFTDDVQTNYPSEYSLPFHFDHPVTGKRR